MFRTLFLVLLVLVSFSLQGQNYNFSGQWQNMGPNDIPYAEKFQYAAGTGPVESIAISPSNPNIMLVTSLNGGVFYSEDGGELWLNAGTDYWDYSASPWADIHPTNDNLWFAVQHFKGKNGKPGKIGKKGGLMRTNDKGVTWTNIAGVSTFGGEFVEIFGTRFHPHDPNKLIIMTTSGLFYTNNCTAEKVEWTKVTAYDGWIYDIDFMDDRMYVSNFQFGNWHIFSVNQNDFNDAHKLESFESLGGEKKFVTFEPCADSLIVLVDYKKSVDKLYGLNPKADNLSALKGSQAVNFGNGHTFEVNPHNSNFMMVGNSTKIRYYDLRVMKTKRIGSEYHVDVEYVKFHPKDTNVIYIATHGGIWKSEDQGVTWLDKTRGLGVAEVMGISADPYDPSRIAIGCYHDGSSFYELDDKGNRRWRIINGGDGLRPLINPLNPYVVYSSNQYVGGGLSVSFDTLKSNKNLHNYNGLKTSGWELAYALHPEQENTLFFNYMIKRGEGANNIDIVRTFDPSERNSAVRISNFKETHGMETYKVYALFNSKYHPDRLFAYVLHFDKDEEGKKVTNHRLFTNENILDSADITKNSWLEMDIPYNSWIGEIAFHPTKENRIFISYQAGNDNPESLFGDKAMVFAIKYKPSTNRVKREIDISKNIPVSIGGRFNMCFIEESNSLLIATRTGVYIGDKRVQKGKSRWTKIGFGLPQCKPMGIEYNEQKRVITVGLFGRGVWQYYL